MRVPGRSVGLTPAYRCYLARRCGESRQYSCLSQLYGGAPGLQIVGAGGGDFDRGAIPHIYSRGGPNPPHAVDLGRVAGAARDRDAVLDRIDQYATVLSDARRQPRAADLAGLVHEALIAFVLDLIRHRLGNRVGRGALDRRILETADAIEPGGIEPAQQLIEFGVGLAGKTDDKGAAQRQVRPLRA